MQNCYLLRLLLSFQQITQNVLSLPKIKKIEKRNLFNKKIQFRQEPFSLKSSKNLLKNLHSNFKPLLLPTLFHST
jgi:hypothetical protein